MCNIRLGTTLTARCGVLDELKIGGRASAVQVHRAQYHPQRYTPYPPNKDDGVNTVREYLELFLSFILGGGRMAGRSIGLCILASSSSAAAPKIFRECGHETLAVQKIAVSINWVTARVS